MLARRIIQIGGSPWMVIFWWLLEGFLQGYWNVGNNGSLGSCGYKSVYEYHRLNMGSHLETISWWINKKAQSFLLFPWILAVRRGWPLQNICTSCIVYQISLIAYFLSISESEIISGWYYLCLHPCRLGIIWEYICWDSNGFYT